MTARARGECSILAGAGLVFALTQTAEAAFHRVAPSGGDYLTVADAVDASSPGDTVAVVAGLHEVGMVELTEGVVLLGGWDPSFTNRVPGTSHLHAFGADEMLILSQGQTTATIIDGFEITGARESAIHCYSSDATISNNEIHDNGGGQQGAAVHCEWGASPIIEYNHIHHNDAVYGAGIEGHWGVDTSPLIRHNVIEYNTAGSAGGGMSLNNGSPIVEDNVIRFNSAGGTGGGVHVWHAGGGVVTVRRNLIIFNESRDGGGLGINGGHPVIESNTFYANDAWRYGGAISQATSAEPDFGTTIVRNNIIANSTNGYGVSCINDFLISLSCNDVYANADGTYQTAPDPVGDIYEDPVFCDLFAFLLQSNSPCAPQNSVCGLIGAYPVGCGTVSLEPASWSKIKAAYR